MGAPKSIALFSADDARSACLMLRVLGPARELGLTVRLGSRWQAKALVDFQPQVVDEAGLVLIQRDFPRYAEAYAAVMARARAAGNPVVYEIDDLLFEPPAEHPVGDYYRAARLPMLRAALEASAIFVSSEPLAGYLRPINSRVWVLPNYLDDRLWKLAEPAPADNQPVVIGFMGGFTHAPDLAMLAPVLADCLATYGDRVRLKLWTHAAPPAALLGQRNVDWIDVEILDYAEFAAYFGRQQCHIGLAPLLASPFNESKSAIKFLEYSAIGAAGIYSRLPPYASVIEPGQNGLLASTLEDWRAALARLIETPALRRQMACAAQQTVRARWLLSAGARQWGEAIECVCAGPAPGDASQSLAALDRLARWRDEQAAELRRDARQQMAEFTQAPAWRVARALQAVGRAVAPAGSRRQRALDWLWRPRPPKRPRPDR